MELLIKNFLQKIQEAENPYLKTAILFMLIKVY